MSYRRPVWVVAASSVVVASSRVPATTGTEPLPDVAFVGSPFTHTVVHAIQCPGSPGVPAPCLEAPYHVDAWMRSPTGESCLSFDPADGGCAIPADFFGPGSDPFTGTVCLDGYSLGEVYLAGFGEPFDLGPADTLVQRSDDPFDRCGLPSETPVTVDLAFDRSNLGGWITVTFDGGQSFMNVEVGLIRSFVHEQPTGSLTATKTHCNGGTFDASFSICPFLGFSAGDVVIGELDYCDWCDSGGLSVTALDVPWVHEAPGLALITPLCSEFVPGVSDPSPATSCDCNENLIRDLCDIESGLSLDCNADGVPDECQPFPPCPADLDGTCDVGFGDLLAFLAAWGSCPGCPEDLDGDGDVGFNDLLVLLGAWGSCAG